MCKDLKAEIEEQISKRNKILIRCKLIHDQIFSMSEEYEASLRKIPVLIETAAIANSKQKESVGASYGEVSIEAYYIAKKEVDYQIDESCKLNNKSELKAVKLIDLMNELNTGEGEFLTLMRNSGGVKSQLLCNMSKGEEVRKAINAHSQASVDSSMLCEKLFAELSRLIPKLLRNSTKGSCGIWQDGRTRFAYVYHSKTKSQIEIWCRGNIADLLQNDPGLEVRGRENPGPGWEESFPARFCIYGTDQIPVAAKYLKDISFCAYSRK